MKVDRRPSRWTDRIGDALVPEQHGPEAESLERRGRLLLMCIAIASANVLFSAIVHSFLGNTRFVALMLSPLILAVAMCAALRSGVSIRLLTQLMVGAIYAVSLIVTLATDGQVSGGRFFMVLVPAVAVLLVDRRSGLRWTGLTVLTLFGTGPLADRIPWEPIVDLTAEQVRGAAIRSAVLVTLAVTAVAFFYSRLHEQAEAALRRTAADAQEGERRFRALSENAYDVIAELDGDGHVIFASPGVEEVLGWRPDEIVGIQLFRALDSDDVQRAREYWQQLFEKGVVRQEPLRYRSKTRGPRWLEVSMRLYPGAEGAQRIVAVARDVTERLDHEKLMRHQERLVSSGTMAAGAAHQLNNPIATILSTAQMARRLEDGSSFGKAAREALEEIEEAAKRCGQILRSMLSFAKQEPAERWTEDLRGILYRAVRAVQSEESGGGAEIVLSFCEESTLAHVSPIEIEQVVINLTRNAIEAGAGVIVIGLDARDDDSLEITVSDDGSGLGPGAAADAFDAFFTTRPGSGSGLGLATARQIVEAHGGELMLSETGSEGSVFRIRLPRAH